MAHEAYPVLEIDGKRYFVIPESDIGTIPVKGGDSDLDPREGEAFGAYVRRVRKAYHGEDLSAFARKVQLAQPYLWKIENKVGYNPHQTTKEKIIRKMKAIFGATTATR